MKVFGGVDGWPMWLRIAAGLYNLCRQACFARHGYGLIEPQSGDIPQIAVGKAHRQGGAGSTILKSLLGQNKTATARVIDVDMSRTSLLSFLASHNMVEKGRQYEMTRRIARHFLIGRS